MLLKPESDWMLEEQLLVLQTAQQRDRARIGQLEDAVTLLIEAIETLREHIISITPKYA